MSWNSSWEWWNSEVQHELFMYDWLYEIKLVTSGLYAK